MEVILDELMPIEFFAHGGIVKITVNDEKLIKDFNLKKKYTFFDYKSYIRFFRNLYMSYSASQPGTNSYEHNKQVNKMLTVTPSIGKYEYVVDLEYDRVSTYELAKFYFSRDKSEIEIDARDPYGIKNVNFSLVEETDERWNEYTKQRLERGFDNSELWNLDGTFAKFIYPRLKAFLEATKECPQRPEGITYEQWISILEKMVNGFELLSRDAIRTDDEMELINDALKLFAEHFLNLWN